MHRSAHSTELGPQKVNVEKPYCDLVHQGTACEFPSLPQFFQGLWEEPG